MCTSSVELPSTYQLMKQAGLVAKKSYGQNFLLNPDVTNRIAKQVVQLSNSCILEIGSGPGGLTRSLLEAGAPKILAIEKDSACLEILHILAAHYPGRLEIIQADALQIDEMALLQQYNTTGLPPQIVANLPYNISTALLQKWLGQTPLWSGMVLMFQKEVADRLLAQVGNKTYGKLSILTQSIFQLQRAFNLAPTAFFPPPKIYSSVLKFTLRPVYPSAQVLATMDNIIDYCFSQRRKTLANICKQPSTKLQGEILLQLLTAHNISSSLRPEQLTIVQLQLLAEQYLAMNV